MKKLLPIIFCILMLFNYTSCKNTSNNNVSKSLGSPVSSLTYETHNGELLTIDENSDFYTVIRELNCNFYVNQAKYKVFGRVQLEKSESESYINFYSNGISTLEEIESYSKFSKKSLKYSSYRDIKQDIRYVRYNYKNKNYSEKIMGFKIDTPILNSEFPDSNAEFGKMMFISNETLSYLHEVSLHLFSIKKSFSSWEKEYDYSSYIKTELELHDNYIVFTQESPFINETSYEQVERNLAQGIVYKQVAYFNLKTGKIDYVQIQRSIVNNELLFEEVKDYSYYHIEELDQKEYNKKVNKLKNYINLRISIVYYVALIIVPLLSLIVLIILLKKHKKKRKNQIIIDEIPVKQ